VKVDEERLLEAVEEFNRYHGAEAQAELVDVREDGFTIRFKGYMCLTCGYYDYFEDLGLEVQDKASIRARPVEVVEEEPLSVLVRFKAEPGPSKASV